MPPSAPLPQPVPRERRPAAAGAWVAAAAVRVGRWLGSLDRRPAFDADARHDPVAELTAPAGPPSEPRSPSEPRFPTAAFGYNRPAVDAHLAALRSELDELRAAVDPLPSINQEIARLGEHAASILVSAHDTAHETARSAQERAARAVGEATADAQRITAEAQRRLRALDEETDVVWRERERLLDDVREVSRTLATLAQGARERFPAADPRSPLRGT